MAQLKQPYFGVAADQAIAQYKAEKDPKAKDKIFVREIMPAFNKLISYYYFKMPVARNPEIQVDCLSFLVEQIHKFDEKAHTRAFPYFNVIVKHFFIQQLKKEKKQISNDQHNFADLQQAQEFEIGVDHVESQIEVDQFLENFKLYLDEYLKLDLKEQERNIVGAIITVFNNVRSLDLVSKKAIMFYLSEMTGYETKKISQTLSKVKKKYFLYKKRYEKGEIGQKK